MLSTHLLAISLSHARSLNSHMYIQKTVLRKHACWLVKNRVCITRWRHRTSVRCWRSDDVSKENLHFDNQSWQVVFLFLVALFSKRNRKPCTPCIYRVIQTRVKVWENSKKLWKHSPAARVPTAFLVLPNFHSCLYNSIETRYMFSIS